MKHVSVLLNETIENLNIKENGIYVDATLGYAGHAKEILKRNKKGFLFAFDQDDEAVKASKEILSSIGQNFKIIHQNFSSLKDEIKVGSLDGIIFDLGVSSPQIDDKDRGFSFMKDANLDMRMDQRQKIDAKYVVNNYPFEELVHIFFNYGEEKLSKVIAKKIVEERTKKEINTTKELVEIIRSAVGAKYSNLHHPERKIFQAIRIEVNKELDVLLKAINDSIDLLKSGGRMCVITFHSLEDRIVKNIFKSNSEINDLVKGLPENQIPKEYKPKIKLITKKPIIPGDEEQSSNPRSKSAKLRVIERL